MKIPCKKNNPKLILEIYRRYLIGILKYFSKKTNIDIRRTSFPKVVEFGKPIASKKGMYSFPFKSKSELNEAIIAYNNIPEIIICVDNDFESDLISFLILKKISQAYKNQKNV